MHRVTTVRLLLLAFVIGVLAACSSAQDAPDMPPLPPLVRSTPETSGANDADDAPTGPIATATPSPVPTEPPGTAREDQLAVAFADNVPDAARAAALRNPAFGLPSAERETDLTLTMADPDDVAAPLGEWVYAVTAAFPTVEDDIGSAALRALWLGDAEAGTLYASQDTVAALQPLFGDPGEAVSVVASDEIEELLWENDGSRAVVPFDALTPRQKVLRVDGDTPLYADADLASYPLVVALTAADEADAPATVTAITNRDVSRLTHVAMTGVTALVRATASQMEANGILWPGEEVREVLRSADIAHISNEVSFDEACPFPNPVGGTSFCSDDRYMALLQDLGTDVIELTGNHLNDYGRENVGRSMDMYAEVGMETFGGGRTLDEAGQPLIVEHNGNIIAFVGCNSFGPEYAWATEDSGGSNPCDGSLPQTIADLKTSGALVIATLQYSEFYFYEPTAEQRDDFRALAEAGADAVSGSQGHHAQGFDFHENGFIHYGLGNLFFDQMNMLGTRQAFIDNYIVYDGQLINVDLTTALIEEFARPRIMTPEERRSALEALFSASGW